MDWLFGLNISKRMGYTLVILSVVTFLFGPIMLGIHYETHTDITKPIIIISWIFTGFWGLIFSLLIGLILFLVCFLITQCCYTECCNEDSSDIRQDA